MAQGLLARGLAQGDRVLMYCENSVEVYVTKIGIAKAGLVCVPVNPQPAANTARRYAGSSPGGITTASHGSSTSWTTRSTSASKAPLGRPCSWTKA